MSESNVEHRLKDIRAICDSHLTVDSTSTWKTLNRDGDVTFYERKTQDYVEYKASATIFSSLDIVNYVLTNPKCRVQWDKLFKDGHTLDRLDLLTEIGWVGHQGSWRTSPFDIVACMRSEVLPKTSSNPTTIITYGTSVDHVAMAAGQNEYKRLHLDHFIMIFKPVKSGLGDETDESQACSVSVISRFLHTNTTKKGLDGLHNLFSLVELNKFLSMPSINTILLKNLAAERRAVIRYWSGRGVNVGDAPTFRDCAINGRIFNDDSDDDDDEYDEEDEDEEDEDEEEMMEEVETTASSAASSSKPVHTTANTSSMERQSLKQEDYSISIAPLPKSDMYDSILSACRQQAWGAVSSDNGWNFQLEKNNIKVYLKPGPPGEAINLCKGVGKIHATPEVVRCVFTVSEIRTKWDGMYAGGRIVEQVDCNTIINHSKFNAPWPISPRDFCTIGRSEVLEDGSIFIYFANYEHPEVPVEKKFVRGRVIFSGTYIRPLKDEPGWSEVVYALGQDPGGSIPIKVINAANVEQPMCLFHIANLIAKDAATVKKAVDIQKATFQNLLTKFPIDLPSQPAVTTPVANEATVSAPTAATSESTTTTTTTQRGDDSESSLDPSQYSVSIEKLPSSKFDAELEAARAEAWKNLHEQEGWNVEVEKDGVVVSIKPQAPDAVPFSRGVGTVECTPEQLRCILAAVGTRTKWDEMYGEGRVIEQIDSNTAIGYAYFNAPWPVSGRDFCSISRTEVLPDGTIFMYSANSEDPRATVRKGFVRGRLIFSAFFLKPVENGTKTEVTYALGNDPCGNIPIKLKYVAAIGQPMCIAKLASLVKSSPDVVTKAVNEQKEVFAKIVAEFAARNAPATSNPDIPTIYGGNTESLSQADYSVSIGNLSPTKFDDVLNETFATAWEAATRHEEDGWVFHSEAEGIRIYLKQTAGSPVQFSKGIGQVKCKPEVLRSLFSSAGTRPKWDAMYGGGRVIEQIDSNTVISYAYFNAPWPVSGRDFCTVGRTVVLPDGGVFVFFTNYEDPRAVPRKGFVRGKLIYSSMLIKPSVDNPEICDVVYALGQDPCGSIPEGLKNAAAITQPLCVAKVAKLIETDPLSVAQAMRSERANFNKIMGISTEDDNDGPSEHIPGISSVTWPLAGKSASQGETTEAAPQEDWSWKDGFDKFYSGSLFSHMIASVNFIRNTGGLFPTLKPAGINPSTLPIDASSFAFGQLAIRPICLRGSYIPVFSRSQIHAEISFGNAIVGTTPPGPVFPDNNTSRWHVPITRLSHSVNVTIFSLFNGRRTTIGTVQLSLGELHNGGSGSPTEARRGWFSVSDIPVEVDRIATRVHLKRKASGQPPVVTHSPTGLFLCLETSVLLNPIRLFAWSAQTTEPNLLTHTIHTEDIFRTSILSSSTLVERPRQQEKLIAGGASTDAAKIKSASTTATTLTSAGFWGDITVETSRGISINPENSTEVQHLLTPVPYSPELLTRSLARLFVSLAPIISFIRLSVDIFTFKDPARTALVVLLWVLGALHVGLIPALLVVIPLWYIIVSAANHHFSRATSVAANRQKTVELHEQRLRYVVNKLHSLEPRLSAKSKGFLLILQTLIGRSASLCERVTSLFNWTHGDALTGAVAVILIIVGVTSLLFGPSVALGFAIVMTFGWYSTPVVFFRQFVLSSLNYIGMIETLQRESQLIRMLALRSQPETIVTKQA